MLIGIECQCCKEMEGTRERLAENSYRCITDHEHFKVVCLNKDVLYTVLVLMNTIRGDPLSVLLSNRYVIVIIVSLLNKYAVHLGRTD